jgi:DNA-binding FrmR family transcriptional regulator
MVKLIELNMLPNDLTKELQNRLKGIKGQLEGVIRMLDQSDDPEQIFNQFKAVSSGIEKATHLLLDEVFRKALAISISKALNDCPGNCGQEKKIELIKGQFPNLSLSELAGKMKEMETINDLLQEREKEIPLSIKNGVSRQRVIKKENNLETTLLKKKK